jgi:hypothetical protein
MIVMSKLAFMYINHQKKEVKIIIKELWLQIAIIICQKCLTI